MDAPPVRYVTTSDGFSVAYAVSGHGRPFVLLPGAFEHVQLAWQYPRLQPWLEGLAARFQLIQIDVRGAGMSSGGLTEDHAREHYVRDIEAVVEHLNPAPLVLYAAAYRVPSALQFALEHPERVSALVIGPTRLSQSSSVEQTAFFTTLPRGSWDLFLRSLASLYQTEEDVPKSVALLRQAFTQDDFAQHMRVAVQGIPEEFLSRLRTPTLILEPSDYFGREFESMKIAQLARATLSAIDGAFALGDAEQGLRAIEGFLADLPPSAALPASPQTTMLSAREVEVLRLIAAGKTNPQIADELVISRNTVQNHVASILSKAGLANRAEAAAYAQRHGLV